ncbi:lysophospholipid acyltransferase family protein [Sinomonas sp. JGH33]|uniref:Lysophospholipid acyltransferase family protein n=1 Tax=Sinomonas terricola TaxID=3110330 RepID=A0ABU5T537_9MICC|nr:lysophospholipid acyltransferase family protein [Sinomonas sp. JGH33]MEA5454647.1 lysophospholipid acyltransferase family protein [Sinomonas sp. JGH33]
MARASDAAARTAPRGLPLYDLARFLFAWLARRLRTDVAASGLENIPPGQVVLAITHFGYIDFVPVGLVWWQRRRERLRFLVGPRPYRSRILGAAITACGGLAVLGAPNHASLAASLRALDGGWSVALFPEAGVSRSFTVRRCHTGAVRIAVQTAVPLVPVAVWGGHRVTTRGHGTFGDTGSGSLRDLWEAPIRVHFGPPLALDPADDPEASAEQLQAAMQAAADVAVRSFRLGAPPGAWWLPAKFGGGAPTEAERDIWDARDAMNGMRPDRDKM